MSMYVGGMTHKYWNHGSEKDISETNFRDSSTWTNGAGSGSPPLELAMTGVPQTIASTTL
jgi:hypothetical protein